MLQEIKLETFYWSKIMLNYSLLHKVNHWKIVVLLCIALFALWNYWLLGYPQYLDSNDQERRTYNWNNSVINKDIYEKAIRLDLSNNVQYIFNNRTMVRPTNDTDNSYPRYDNPESGIVIYGKIQKGYDYAVFSSTMHNQDSLNYLFDLPLTALAWERIGFRSIIILVQDSSIVVSNQKVQYVLATLFQLQSVVVIIESHQNFAVMISQVSRLFVPYLLDLNCIMDETSWEETYLVTSDADLWPLYRDKYLLPDEHSAILSLNAYCCGDFLHNGKSYTMIPIGNIGMKVKTWRSVTRRRGFVPLNVDGIITYISREFGTVATSAVQKGENLGWFLDQRMITILIADWSKRDGNAAHIRYIKRDVGSDRIDRSSWRPHTLGGKIDAHILDYAYEFKTWHRLEAILVLMYDTKLFNWCAEYARTFTQLS